MYRDESMNALADKAHKQRMSQWYTLHSTTTLFNNHPYISSCKFSANWHATTTYVGMVVE